MFVGPVLSREMAIAPRRTRIYVARAVYAAALWLLVVTAYLVLTGTQLVRDVGDLARFGTTVFQILAPLQLALGAFFAGLLSASAVAQEKDRRTLVLLLMTRLSNSELVLGRLLASLLHVLVMLAAALPVFMLIALWGGVSFAQIGQAFAVTVLTVLVCGSLGSTLALWREKTFQALAMTALVVVLWLAFWEAAGRGALGNSLWGISSQSWAAGFSPWSAILEVARPLAHHRPALGLLGSPVSLFLIVSATLCVLLNGVAIVRVRAWNPSREALPAARREAARPSPGGSALRSAGSATGPRRGVMRAVRSEEASPAVPRGGIVQPAVPVEGAAQPRSAAATSQPAGAAAVAAPARRAEARTRRVWDNPIVWREIRTWAYGRKTLVMRLAYLGLFALAAASLSWMVGPDQVGGYSGGGMPMATLVLAGLVLLSLVLVNAQAVTSMTAERDLRALDLLLVTDLTPKEIVFGKLGGVFYNTKEMVVLPVLLCVYLWWSGGLGREGGLQNLVYLVVGMAVLYVFVAVLGIHAGMIYANSRGAVATSLGTVFFLSVGVAVGMRMLMAFSNSPQAQLPSFLALMIGGGIGLYVALGARNPSAAIGVASFLCPVATFYAITSYLLGSTLGVFLVTAAVYGFFTTAMLVPAIYEFDVATGRTTIEEPR